MTQLQLAYLEKERTYSANSGTIYIDLPSNELISMLMVEFQVDKGGTVLYSRTLLDAITKVRVLLEGSKTAFSANPFVGTGMAYLQSGQVPPHNYTERPTGQEVMRLPIYFGRFPGDPDYMLDTGQYSSAQLQIDYALNTTYEGTGSSKVTVWFLRPFSRGVVRGFIRSRQIHDKTSSGSAEEIRVDLPTGLPWFSVGFRSFDIDRYVKSNVTDVDLDIDEGRMHLFNGRIEDLMLLQKMMFDGLVLGSPVYAYGTGDTYVQSHLAAWESAVGMSFANIGEYPTTHSWNGQRAAVCMRTDAAGVSTTARAVFWQFKGVGPEGNFIVFDGRELPFGAPAFADAKLIYQQGAYTNIIQTWLQEVVEGVL